MALGDITSSEVLRAIEEFDRVGRERFLRDHGFGRARRYLLSYEGKLYDSKAIVGAAHGYLAGQECLVASDFSGGVSHVVKLLRHLGFVVVDDAATSALTQDGLLERLARLKVNRASGSPALYQPIVLLWALGRAHRGEPRLLPWSDTERALRELLTRHGMRGERPRPDYPVLALYRADMWVLHDQLGTVPTAHGDAALKRWFAENQPQGGLPERLYDLFQRSGEARILVIDALLCTYFDGLDYGPLLTDVGLYDDAIADDGMGSDVDTAGGQVAVALDAVTVAAQYERLCRIVEHRESEDRGERFVRTSNEPIRSGSARRAVLLRSEGGCENPSCTGQPADVTARGDAILEVDHVEDLAQGGRDHPSQMVALCPNCHAIKTRGRTRETLRARLLQVAQERHAKVARGSET